MCGAAGKVMLHSLYLASALEGVALWGKEEFQLRLLRTQSLMAEEGLDALLVTTEANVHYFTGFHSPFWQSPTRPWYVVVPKSGEPIAVVPTIGEASFEQGFVQEVRSWPSPHEADDGVSELASVLSGLPLRSGHVGAELGHEMPLRMPYKDLSTLMTKLAGSGRELRDATMAIKKARVIKTDQEVSQVAAACQAQSDAYDMVPSIIKAGMTERQACQAFKRQLLLNGVDDTNYVICRSAEAAYSNIIGHPTSRVLRPGDIMVLDTGSTVGGYYCDFNRNFAVGAPADEEVSVAYERLYNATDQALALCKPGTTMAELFDVMVKAMGLDGGPETLRAVGRMGHHVGLQLTEWPSLMPGEDVPLEENMVITLEPSYPLKSGRGFVVTEEVVQITADGPRLLSKRAPKSIPIAGRVLTV
jgi:Xaa-Pro aminopeptidase